MVVLLEVTPARAIGELQRELNFSTGELASALDATPRTVKRWRENEAYPQREKRARLADLVALVHHLRDTFGDLEPSRAWLYADNRHLGGMTPAEALRVGRIDRVEAALEALDSGVFV